MSSKHLFATESGQILSSGKYVTIPIAAGTVTFASAGTATVTFPNAQVDTSYRLAFGPRANETVWATGITTAGFTLHSSNSSSTAQVDWILSR